jgi:hypothetical protein
VLIVHQQFSSKKSEHLSAMHTIAPFHQHTNFSAQPSQEQTTIAFF